MIPIKKRTANIKSDISAHNTTQIKPSIGDENIRAIDKIIMLGFLRAVNNR
jgi:hypothetical protein